MQVWVTASARAPIVGGVAVDRMAPRTAPFHRRTGLTPGTGVAGGAGDAGRAVAATRPAGTRPRQRASAAIVRPRAPTGGQCVMKTWPISSSPPKRHVTAATVDGEHIGLYWSQKGVEKWMSKRSPPAWTACWKPP